MHLVVGPCSGALLRSDGREGRPGLFCLETSAVWARSLFRVMLCDGQNLRECDLAGPAEKLIVGHSNLPRSLERFSWILDPPMQKVQHGPPTKRARFLAGLAQAARQIG